MRVPLTCLALLLGACVGVERPGTPRAYAQALDTETNACIRFPGSCPGSESLARQRVAEAGASIASVAAALRPLDKGLQTRIEEAILDCVMDADFKLNERLFGGSPTREQCSEVVERDARGEPVTRAMFLGRQKHQLALQCIEQKLSELRPGSFSLNQRYRLNENTGKWEPLSRKEVETLLRTGGKDLVGTLEPDIVIHTGNPAEVLDVFDLKFPCPGTNRARWNAYPEGHPHRPLSQGEMYEQAFGINPARVAPRWNVRRLREP